MTCILLGKQEELIESLSLKLKKNNVPHILIQPDEIPKRVKILDQISADGDAISSWEIDSIKKNSKDFTGLLTSYTRPLIDFDVFNQNEEKMFVQAECFSYMKFFISLFKNVIEISSKFGEGEFIPSLPDQWGLVDKLKVGINTPWFKFERSSEIKVKGRRKNKLNPITFNF